MKHIRVKGKKGQRSALAGSSQIYPSPTSLEHLNTQRRRLHEAVLRHALALTPLEEALTLADDHHPLRKRTTSVPRSLAAQILRLDGLHVLRAVGFGTATLQELLSGLRQAWREQTNLAGGFDVRVEVEGELKRKVAVRGSGACCADRSGA